MSVFAPDAISGVVHTAMDGLSFRQRVIADNIANVDTPGYRATSVEFEDALASAINSGSIRSADDAGSIAPRIEATNTPVGTNGNNVDLRKETMAAMQSQYQYQMMSKIATERAGIITAVAGGVR